MPVGCMYVCMLPGSTQGAAWAYRACRAPRCPGMSVLLEPVHRFVRFCIAFLTRADARSTRTGAACASREAGIAPGSRGVPSPICCTSCHRVHLLYGQQRDTSMMDWAMSASSSGVARAARQAVRNFKSSDRIQISIACQERQHLLQEMLVLRTAKELPACHFSEYFGSDRAIRNGVYNAYH